ncbi:MAG: hypothetical protein RLZZ76_498 [Candidatus Parcubacteria bacterium]|jgi:hypothetical protein
MEPDKIVLSNSGVRLVILLPGQFKNSDLPDWMTPRPVKYKQSKQDTNVPLRRLTSEVLKKICSEVMVKDYSPHEVTVRERIDKKGTKTLLNFKFTKPVLNMKQNWSSEAVSILDVLLTKIKNECICFSNSQGEIETIIAYT